METAKHGKKAKKPLLFVVVVVWPTFHSANAGLLKELTQRALGSVDQRVVSAAEMFTQ